VVRRRSGVPAGEGPGAEEERASPHGAARARLRLSSSQGRRLGWAWRLAFEYVVCIWQ
jgi:hypothetical protein